MILLFSLLCAADPWNRPQHFRIVTQQPKRWKDVWKERYKHRFWWDEDEEKAQIQWLSPKGWKTIKKRARPGWIGPSLPLGSRFRIRFPSSSRWSEITQATPWFSAHTMAQLAQPEKCSKITTLATNQEGLWGGSMDGGLLLISKNNKKTKLLSTWDGLWDDRVLSIDGIDQRLLVGTAGGAVLFSEGIPMQSWKEELIHPYTQVASIQEDDLWLGGFRGLHRIRGGEFEIKRREHSVFSIAPFRFGETLIGYDGLQYNTTADNFVSFSSFGNIYDLLYVDDTIWFTSDKYGVASIRNQNLRKHHKETPNTLFWKDGLWMGGKKGLYHPKNKWNDQFGEVFDILEQNQKIWFSSEKGLYSYQKTALNELPCSGYSIPKNGTLYTTEQGVSIRGNHSVSLGDIKTPDWTQSKKGWHPVSLSGSWRDIAFDGKRMWSLDAQGIWVHMTKSKLMYEQNDLKEIAVSSLSIWGRTQDDQLVRHTLGKKETYDIPDILAISAGKNSICVGTQKGLFRIGTKGKKVERWYTKNRIPVVYSTEDGDCWFASDSEQVGVVYTTGQELQWDTPSRMGILYDLQVQKQGLWVYSSKGLWLMRKRVP